MTEQKVYIPKPRNQDKRKTKSKHDMVSFIGRDMEIGKIKKLCSGDNLPFIIVIARSGYGKSALCDHVCEHILAPSGILLW
jgi:hypothetical protein